MPANRSNLATTFTAPPVGQLVDQQSGMASQRFQIWLNALFKRFLIQRTNLTQVSNNYAINLQDSTLQAIITQPNPIVLTLPDPTQIQGQIYNIKNDATSVSTVSMAATGNALIDNQPASSVVLSPGQVVTLKSDGTNWIKLAFFSNSVNSTSPPATSTNSANGTPAVPLGPGGTPTTSTPVPPGTPTVTTLPGPLDPLSVVDQLVLLNGVPYRFTAGLGGGAGYWALDVTGSPSIRDTWANLSLYPAANYAVGTVFYATDRQVSYAVQVPTPSLVKTWIYYNGIYETTLSGIPMDLGLESIGFIFRASDYLHNWLWNGTAWHLTTGGFPPGYIIQVLSPAYLPPGALWHALDGSTVPISQDNATLVNEALATVAGEYIAQ